MLVDGSGNICRSPIAEAVFAHIAKQRGVLDQWVIDSAATGDWHVGCQPDKRARNCMKKYGIEMNHKARLVYEDDFNNFDYVFGMDENNINDLKEIAPRSYTAKLELLGKYDPEGELIIEDPYYDRGDEGFEKVYEQCIRCCNNFLDKNP
ncbi:low molecular weight phosphotyrosine protein phosphatase-like isoform X2 [Limulus polyphemus]|uniref:Low molecular weight phosphotyrosine protein phosphatase n=1 Tax=Limulus polyphemus TaxID=6850 RepID=A0ABM1TJL9_LIMPO|nr:low molecular weight phosphotyrosine protein phosphatase-like isoform X2 [Limulus polyphemus]